MTYTLDTLRKEFLGKFTIYSILELGTNYKPDSTYYIRVVSDRKLDLFVESEIQHLAKTLPRPLNVEFYSYEETSKGQT